MTSCASLNLKLRSPLFVDAAKYLTIHTTTGLSPNPLIAAVTNGTRWVC